MKGIDKLSGESLAWLVLASLICVTGTILGLTAIIMHYVR